MPAGPLVSVIVPAYNAEDVISETLDSILAQSYRSFEIIVVDDGSNDGTHHSVERFAPKVRYYHQENGGAGIARNTGIKHSAGEYLCFMDADDLMVENRLERQLDFLRRYPQVGLVFCDYRNFNEKGPYLRSHFQTCPRLWPQLQDHNELVVKDACALLAQENFGCAGTLFMRKEMLRFEPGFDPRLRTWEDLYFYFRLARHTGVGVINEVGLMRRLHQKNTTANAFLMFSDGIDSCKLLLQNERDPAVRVHLEKHVKYCQRGLARYHADHGQYLLALRDDLSSVARPLSWWDIRAAGKNIARTVLMAAGVHHSTD